MASPPPRAGNPAGSQMDCCVTDAPRNDSRTMTILPIDPVANATPEALNAFLEQCRLAAQRDRHAKLVSISLAVDALDPLAVLESIFEPGEPHFYAERPGIE